MPEASLPDSRPAVLSARGRRAWEPTVKALTSLTLG